MPQPRFVGSSGIIQNHGERGQVVKAVDCDSTIRGFKSRRSPSFFNKHSTSYGLGLLSISESFQAHEQTEKSDITILKV